MSKSISSEWETPQELYEKLDKEFHFTLDPCCQEYNHKCDKYYTAEVDGLNQDWRGEIVFCNPPYGHEIKFWVEKCFREGQHPDTTVVMLIPARTDTQWFHKYILGKAEVRFLQGRLKFINRMLPSWREDGNFKISPAPFPSMVVIFKNENSTTT